jgi:hypothetical protein
VTAEDNLAAFAAQVPADSQRGLSGPVSEHVRHEWLDMLALVEDLLALQHQVTQPGSAGAGKRIGKPLSFSQAADGGVRSRRSVVCSIHRKPQRLQRRW